MTSFVGTFCKDCGHLHDLERGPDDGVCLDCGGPLVDDASENPVDIRERVVIDLVAETNARLRALKNRPGDN